MITLRDYQLPAVAFLASTRRDVIESFKAGKVRALIATSLLDEGFDAPVASVLILAIGGVSFRKSVQATGRVLRPFPGKSHGLIIDFKDSCHGMLRAQTRKRAATYRDLSYQQINPPAAGSPRAYVPEAEPAPIYATSD